MSNQQPDSKQILIVDDSAEIQELLSEFFLGLGYQTSCASNGREALELLRSERPAPALILLDLMMPEVDGFQFFEEQQRDKQLSLIPTIVMTAGGDVQLKRLSLDGRGYLKKPFRDLDTILSTVERYLKV